MYKEAQEIISTFQRLNLIFIIDQESQRIFLHYEKEQFLVIIDDEFEDMPVGKSVVLI